MSAWYRVQQFFQAVRARVEPEERELVRRLLPPAAADLFSRLPRQDQRHGLDVAGALLQRRQDDPDLLAAALLHDAGKAVAGLTVFHRSAIVLLAHWGPGWLRRLGSGRRRWQRPFWVHLHHPALGAELARGAGCSERTARLIALHHAEPVAAGDAERVLLAALQEQDAAH